MTYLDWEEHPGRREVEEMKPSCHVKGGNWAKLSETRSADVMFHKGQKKEPRVSKHLLRRAKKKF